MRMYLQYIASMALFDGLAWCAFEPRAATFVSMGVGAGIGVFSVIWWHRND